MTETWTPETVKGWRLFIWNRFAQYDRAQQKLYSITISTHPWDREMPPATCMSEWAPIKTAHDTPHPDCACGYWSLKPGLLAHPFEWTKPVWDMTSVVMHATLAWVESWGTVWEYEYGYRAERMKISSLIALTPEWADKYYRWYMSNDQIRRNWAKRDLENYIHRVEQAAAAYDLPIVEMGSTTEDTVLPSVMDG